MIEQPGQPAPTPKAQVVITAAGSQMELNLAHCTPQQAVDMLCAAIKMIAFAKPQQARPGLLVPNGMPLPNLRT